MSLAIFGDWGTTRLRLFLLRDGRVIDQLSGPGIGRLAGTPAEALTATVAPWANEARRAGILLSGMAGSRNGLVEVPYASLPATASQWAETTLRVDVEGIAVTVAAGLSGANFIGRPDVMRGEEAQIFGAIALDPALAAGRHLLVLPGTHSKWVELVDGRVNRFHTFVTGEMFALLRDHSSLTRANAEPDGQDEGFEAGLAQAREGLIAGLFEARAAQLVEGRSQGWALGLLSGLLIGSELREATALLGHTPPRVGVIGDPSLGVLYARAFTKLGGDAVLLDGDSCAIAGLRQLAEEGFAQ